MGVGSAAAPAPKSTLKSESAFSRTLLCPGTSPTSPWDAWSAPQIQDPALLPGLGAGRFLQGIPSSIPPRFVLICITWGGFLVLIPPRVVPFPRWESFQGTSKLLRVK